MTEQTLAHPPAEGILPPLVPGWPLAGIAWQMRVDPLGTMNRAMADLGDVIRMKLGPYHATLFRNPEHIKHIFVDNADNYSKQTRGYEKSKLVLGLGLVTSEGELWKRQRRIAMPAFSRQRVTGFATVMTDSTTAMLKQWEAIASPARLDVFSEMMHLTLRIALETLLGVGESSETQKLSRAVSLVLERTNDIITNPLSLPLWVPTPKNVTFKRAIAELDRFVYSTIERKRRNNAGDNDLLSMLMSARDEQTGNDKAGDDKSSGAMSDKQLRDEAVTTLIAGHETVANVLTWALHLLATHPQEQEELAAEAATVLGGRVPTANDVPNLRFTRMVIDESMRLYPPAWMIGRAAIESDVVNGWRVNKGSFTLVSPYMTHRHPGLWDNPDSFDPHRFGDGRSERAPKFSYIPFGAGQRFCIGSTFALLEGVLLLAGIVQRFRFKPVSDARIEPYAMITLRPRYGMPLLVRKR